MASFIKSIHISKLPSWIPTTGWQDEHLSVSPNGRYAIRYYDSYEMTNSAYHWHIALLENGRDVSNDHPMLISIPWSWYHESEDENPYIWNYTGQVVTLARWHDPRLYYNIETKHLFQIECKEAGQLHTACFSPTWDRIIVRAMNHGVLCDSTGKILPVIYRPRVSMNG